ncbi:metallophosphoesterase [Mobilitalea sibirica]|uniref:Metallophosphoesterase n=1 Tax=Mobilitalea sibirica TaxID=1462919 RepID=A0A8J7KTK4_9FIRM|nr:metallophosphoesterase [Mobilitalea sibirica]MBH1941481.1 metallophosphoesterase [Mobilitalea sibirica]
MNYIIIILGLLILWSLIEQKLLVTSSYELTTDKLGGNETISFVVLADLHNHTFGKNNNRLLNEIDRLSPELIIIAGDLITKRMKCIPGNAHRLVEELAKKYKIYYAYGNHEEYFEALCASEDKTEAELYSSWREYKERLNQIGVIFLDNNSCLIHKNNLRFRITGLTLGIEHYEKHKKVDLTNDIIESKIGKSKKKLYEILIAHNPVFFQSYAGWGADLTLSGHAHGGLIRLPFLGGLISPQVKFFPKYDAGLYTEDNKVMILSRGLGSHSGMLRLFNRPELIHITLKG